ncbi:MAG: hypothetical protein ACFFHD_15005 [Promethearchaeota archaeon]
MSIISTVLAEMSTHDLHGTDQLDYTDHFDLSHVDHVDHLDHIDHVDHLDYVDHVDHLDQIDHTDHINQVYHLDHVNDTTPAPFMLLFSTSLLLFGILGILFFFIFAEKLQFLIFFTTVTITYIFTKLISTSWKKLAKSRFYNISSTKNLIGVKGEVVLNVDEKGGIIKVISYTPMKFEKVHVKPLNPESYFEEGAKVYICDVKDGFFLVDNNIKSIRYRR